VYLNPRYIHHYTLSPYGLFNIEINDEKIFLFKFIPLLIVISLIGCAITAVDDPKIGMSLSTDDWADKRENGSNSKYITNYYLYVAKVEGGTLYRINTSKALPTGFKGGIIVSNEKIVRVLNPNELNSLLADIENKNRLTERNAQQQVEQRQRENDLIKKQAQAKEDNVKYGTTGVGLSVSRIDKECLVSEGFSCRVRGVNLIVSGGIRNNLSQEIKDVRIKCKHFAQSGTELSTLLNTSSTILQKWSPGETRKISFPIADLSQRYQTTCSITGWN